MTTIENFNKKLLECKLRDLTPEAFAALFNYAFGDLSQPKPLVAATSPFALRDEDIADAIAVSAFQVRPPSKPPTKTQRALDVLAKYPKGVSAADLAALLDDEVRLVYPLVSNLKREGRIKAKDGLYILTGAKK